MTQFKSIFQVSQRMYDSIAKSGDGVLYLVRYADDDQYELSSMPSEGEIPDTYYKLKSDAKIIETRIYFGKRLYGTNSGFIIDAFGGLLDVNGQFIFPASENGDTFVNVDETKVNNLLELFQAIDAAISANASKFDNYYTKSEIDALHNALGTIKSVSVKVGEIEYAQTDGGVVSIDLTDAFEAAGKVKDVTVDGVSVVSKSSGVAEIVIPKVSVTNDDGILSFDEGVISTEITFGVDNEAREDGKKYIYLNGKDGKEIGKVDTTDFVVDGMLKSVTPKEEGSTILVFTFNEESGQKPIEVDFAKYVDVYKGDDTSIELKDNVFSVKEVKATQTMTTETIPVAGGPLAQLFEKAGINVSDITAGSSIEDVFFSLLCKELWAKSLTFSEGTVASSIAQPTFTLENSGKTVEVGTKCTLSAITMSAATPSISKNRTYSGFTYGYSSANDNAQDSASTSIVAVVDKDAALNEGNYTMNRDYTQFNGAVDDSATANTDASQVKLDGAELTVSYVGTNSVKVTVGGPTASATFAAMPVYYACSNLKKTKDAVKDSEGQYKSDAKDAAVVTSSAASNSKTLSVTGARAYWMGSVKTAMTEFTSTTVRAAGESSDNHITKALGTNVPTTVTATGGDAQVIIVTQKEITAVNSKNQIGANVFGNFNHYTVNIEGANGFTAISYHVYEWTPANPFDKDDTLTITYK